jgi:hypothetical protein
MKTSFQFNDGGRANAGFKGMTGDCATRAIAIVTELPYKIISNLIKRRIFSGYFIIGNVDKQLPLTNAMFIKESAANYLHLKFKLWYKYGKCKMITCKGSKQFVPNNI